MSNSYVSLPRVIHKTDEIYLLFRVPSVSCFLRVGVGPICTKTVHSAQVLQISWPKQPMNFAMIAALGILTMSICMRICVDETMSLFPFYRSFLPKIQWFQRGIFRDSGKLVTGYLVAEIMSRYHPQESVRRNGGHGALFGKRT